MAFLVVVIVVFRKLVEVLVVSDTDSVAVTVVVTVGVSVTVVGVSGRLEEVVELVGFKVDEVVLWVVDESVKVVVLRDVLFNAELDVVEDDVGRLVELVVTLVVVEVEVVAIGRVVVVVVVDVEIL